MGGPVIALGDGMFRVVFAIVIVVLATLPSPLAARELLTGTARYAVELGEPAVVLAWGTFLAGMSLGLGRRP